jgi:hypothetical protein
MKDSTGSSHNRNSGILLVALSGRSVASAPRIVLPIRHDATQPYQYMAGPSPLLPGAHPKSTRFVAGWKVKSGRLKISEAK